MQKLLLKVKSMPDEPKELASRNTFGPNTIAGVTMAVSDTNDEMAKTQEVSKKIPLAVVKEREEKK